jgi:hypothetical protein
MPEPELIDELWSLLTSQLGVRVFRTDRKIVGNTQITRLPEMGRRGQFPLKKMHDAPWASG